MLLSELAFLLLVDGSVFQPWVIQALEFKGDAMRDKDMFENNNSTYLLRCQSRIRVDIEDPSEQISNFFIAYVAGHLSEFTTLNLSEQICLKLTKEGQLADEDDVENNASGPNIGSLPIVRLLAG